MSEVYEEYRGFNIRIEQDQCCDEGPRDWDNLGTMVCFHSRHVLGDTGGNPRWREHKNISGEAIPSKFPTFHTPDDFRDWLLDEDAVVLSLIIAKHGNVWMSTNRDSYPFNCPWDSGQVGWIYVTHERIAEEYCEVNDKTIARATKCLQAEVETYSHFISGDVYSYIVEDSAGEFMDSCGGYYGYDYEENGLLEAARSHIDWHITKAYRDRAELVKTWIRHKVPHIHRFPMQLAVSA